VLAFLPGYVAVAQNGTATLTGTVEDKSGAVIPNAHIVLTDVASGVTRVMRYPTQLTPGIWIVVNFIAIHRTEDGLVRQRGPPKKCSGQSLPSRY
jgi:hypothetical protein